MPKFSARLGDHWLVLTQVEERTWHLQVLGDTPLEAEVTADDEEGAKASAVSATLERLRKEGSPMEEPAVLNWNAVIIQRWDSRS